MPTLRAFEPAKDLGDVFALWHTVFPVAAAVRGRGIGTALVAQGTEILRERGVHICFLGWVWAVDFYQRLGYEPWQAYTMSSRAIA